MKFVFFGIIQGVTEFLPVSSSGHLFLFKEIFSFSENLLPYFVFLHLATLCAVIVFFWKNILCLLREKKTFSHILIITVISAVLGMGIKWFLSQYFDSRRLVACCFLINAAILFSVGKTRGSRERNDIRLRDSVILGILQGMAVFPGISRSGITIAGFLKRGFNSVESFNLSFLMSLPIIIIAFFSESKELFASGLPLSSLVLSFIFAFFSGILALKVLKVILMKSNFRNFGYYCLLVSLLSLVL